MNKFFDKKEGFELKKISEYYVSNQKKNLIATKVSVEDIFENVVENDRSNIVIEQLQKLSNF